MKKRAYKTKQKEQISDYIKSTNQSHLYVNDIFEHFQKNNENIGLSTIYRQLDNLQKQGEIKKYVLEGETAACYQYTGDLQECHEHAHLKCSVCEALLHLECDYVDSIKKHVLEEHNFCIDISGIVFYGKCESCKK